MKKTALILFFLVFPAVVAFADSVPAISSVSPATGSTVGGTLVAITTSNLSFSCAICSPPYSASVSFGGSASQDVRANGSNIVYAVAPPHLAGTVEVTVVGEGGATASAPAAFTYVDSIFRTDYEAVLLPSPLVPRTAPLPGAFGSLWTTEFWLRNNGAVSALTRFPSLCTGCPVSVQFPTSVAASQMVNLTQQVTAPGLLFYVQKSGASNFSYSARVRDVSRTTLNEGTAIPVVREGEFTAGTIVLLNVPIDTASRAALRIFNVDALGDAMARVTVHTMTSSDFTATTLVTVRASAPADDSVQAGFPAVPGYVSIDDLRTALALPEGAYEVEVTPLGFTGWAFAAVTNNETQLVTTVTSR